MSLSRNSSKDSKTHFGTEVDQVRLNFFFSYAEYDLLESLLGIIVDQSIEN
jgi:hypothetical protein